MLFSLFRKTRPAAGSRPGTLVIHETSPPPRIHVVEYDEDHLSETDVPHPDQISRSRQNSVLWVDVQGFGDESVLRAIADQFHLHPLTLEDVVHVPQRPKVEQFDEHLFVVTRMLRMVDDNRLDQEQVSIFIGQGFILTFQERYGDILDPIRERIRMARGPIRHSGADYLGYAILDRIIDEYYPILESFGEAIEQLEEAILNAARPAVLERMFEARRDFLALRRAIWPQRDALNSMIRDPSPHLGDEVRVYLKDCYDHCIQAIDVIETFRELAGGLMELYLSTLSNSQNEVMKTLTIMASIFIPLTFIAGIYGMNFDHMPELHTRWMYPAVLAVMLAIAGGMVLFFRHKGWLGRKR